MEAREAGVGGTEVELGGQERSLCTSLSDVGEDERKKESGGLRGVEESLEGQK